MIVSSRKTIYGKKRVDVFNKYNEKCAYCGEKLDRGDFVIDHIIPLAKKGGNSIENLNPSCRSCNGFKYTRSIEDFREHISSIFEKEIKENARIGMLNKFGLIKKEKKNIEFYFEKIKKED